MARLYLKTPDEVMGGIGRDAQRLRLYQNLTQAEVAVRAGIGLRTLQRFEKSGKAGVDVMVQVAFVLGVAQTMEGLFPLPEARSIDEVLRRKTPARRRARKARR